MSGKLPGIICSFLILINFPTLAQEVLPNGCSAVVIKGDSITIPAAKYNLVFLHSLSEHDIWLVAEQTGRGMQAGLSTKLLPGKWTALALNKQAQELRFNCIESQPGHEQRTTCREVVAICNWSHVRLPENSQGIFWPAENLGLASLSAFCERNGYALSAN